MKQHIVFFITSSVIIMLTAFGRSPSFSQSDSPFLAVGDPLPRVSCLSGYSATIYADGLTAPDGLAFSPDGVLHVAQETIGQVSQIASNGVVTAVIQGLDSPEGITFDERGNLYVVEDKPMGRLIQHQSNGLTTTIATGLESPEGVIWTANGSDNQGTLYLTEQILEKGLTVSSTNATDYQTYVTMVPLSSGIKTRILTTTAIITPTIFPPNVEALFWSYSGIAYGPDNLIYLANELAGQATETEILFNNIPVPFKANTTDSIFTINPNTPTAQIGFTRGLTVVEGIRFSADGNFPLYAVEENSATTKGRLVQMNEQGEITVICTNFEGLEDVVQDDMNNLYVSEDGTGLVIKISAPQTTTPTPVPSVTASPNQTVTPTPSFKNYIPIIVKEGGSM